MLNIKPRQAELRNLLSRQNFQLILLISILLIVIFPYLQKVYNGYLETKKQEKGRKIQEKIEAQRQAIFNDNKARKDLLAKYSITTLNIDYPCNSEYECSIVIKIPNEKYDYLFGEFRDKKLGSSEQCKKSKDIKSQEEKYIRYCPDGYFGSCGIKLRETDPTSSPSYPLIQYLESKKFDIKLLTQRHYNIYNAENYGMDRCDRLNYKDKFQEFKKEIINLDKMITENIDHPMVKIFNDRYYKNYLLLENELKNAN